MIKRRLFKIKLWPLRWQRRLSMLIRILSTLMGAALVLFLAVAPLAWVQRFSAAMLAIVGLVACWFVVRVSGTLSRTASACETTENDVASMLEIIEKWDGKLQYHDPPIHGMLSDMHTYLSRVNGNIYDLLIQTERMSRENEKMSDEVVRAVDRLEEQLRVLNAKVG